MLISRCVLPTQNSFKSSMKQTLLCILHLFLPICLVQAEPCSSDVFSNDFPKLDHLATGEWWNAGKNKEQRTPGKLNIERNQVIAFALYTYDSGVLKLTAQLYPLLPEESREVRLEVKKAKVWEEISKVKITYPGWSAHFRLEDWDASRNYPYRVRHGEKAVFEGVIRRDPIHKKEIVVGNLSCNSSRDPGPRTNIVNNLKMIDPDLLFFAGDQTYHHTEHTSGWIEFGLQFSEIMKDRPTITIPDDHDIGQANLWGEYGKRAKNPQGPSGGYYYPLEYVKMVERQQTWHLPDAAYKNPLTSGLSTYFTRLRVGGVDFAILEDRKFKSGPEGKIPKMGPRPDHINDPSYDRNSVDLPGLKLLGEEQLTFLSQWSQDWTGAQMKAALSQTAFCGAVHIHGRPNDRLLADLDCNGWPQSGRNKALREIRKAWAPHLCGDQHLAVVVQHGIDSHRDGPFAFTSPAIVNSIYGRWWHPLNEEVGKNPIPGSSLPWTGDYEDGLGNKITMHAYANPPADRRDERNRADGFGIARFNKVNRTITFECWPRFADVSEGDKAQFPGWPVTHNITDNDGREIVGWLPKLTFSKPNQVVQITNKKTNEVLYTIRIQGKAFQPKVYSMDPHEIKTGKNKPVTVVIPKVQPVRKPEMARTISVPI